jgi:hypothetical protein
MKCSPFPYSLLSCLFNNAVSTIYKANGKMIMNDEWERMGRKAVSVCFKVLLKKLSGQASVMTDVL